LKPRYLCAKQSYNEETDWNTTDFHDGCCHSTEDQSCSVLSNLLVIQSLIPESKIKSFKALGEKMKTIDRVIG